MYNNKKENVRLGTHWAEAQEIIKFNKVNTDFNFDNFNYTKDNGLWQKFQKQVEYINWYDYVDTHDHIEHSGIILGMFKKNQKVDLSKIKRYRNNVIFDTDDNHSFIIGATGAGKTVSTLGTTAMLTSWAKRNISLNYDLNNVVISDIDGFNKMYLNEKFIYFKENKWFPIITKKTLFGYYQSLDNSTIECNSVEEFKNIWIDLCNKIYNKSRQLDEYKLNEAFEKYKLSTKTISLFDYLYQVVDVEVVVIKEFHEFINSYWIKELESDNSYYNRFTPQVKLKGESIKDVFVYAPSENVVVNDVKGELYEQLGWLYDSQGFKVRYLDYSNPVTCKFGYSTISPIINFYVTYIKKYYERKKFLLEKFQNDKEYDLTTLEENEVKLFIQLDADYKDAKRERDFYIDSIFSAITGNAAAQGNDKSWADKGDAAIKGIAFYHITKMLNDYIIFDETQERGWKINSKWIDWEQSTGSKYLDQIHLPSISKIYTDNFLGDMVSKQATPKAKQIVSEVNSIEDDIDFLEIGEKYISLLKTFITKPDKEKGSVEGFGKPNLDFFETIKYIEAHSEVDLFDFAKHKATILFMMPVWQNKAYNLFPQVITESITTILATLSKKYVNRRLPLRCNFLLDEFSNFPPMGNISEMISLGRSMGIRFVLVVQTYTQLITKYNKEILDIIKSNCKNFIYLNSTSLEELREVSAIMGKKQVKVITRDINSQTGYTERMEYVELVSTEELSFISNETKRDTFDVLSKNNQNMPLYASGQLTFKIENVKQLEINTKKYLNESISDIWKVFYMDTTSTEELEFKQS